MRLFEAIPELINRSGLRTVFGTPGSSNVPWLAHGVATERLVYVGTRHEAAAVTAAAAYSKTTGEVGLATPPRAFAVVFTSPRFTSKRIPQLHCTCCPVT